jgi:hypothetical protein
MANAADQQQQGLLGDIANARGIYAQKAAARLRQKAIPAASETDDTSPESD